MAFLVGTADTSRFDTAGDIDYSSSTASFYFNGNDTQGVIASATGTANTINLFINDWGVMNEIKLVLYENDQLVTEEIVNPSIGTGLVGVGLTNPVQITSGSAYRLGVYGGNTDIVTMWMDVDGLTQRKVTAGSFESPSQTISNGQYVQFAEFYWSIEDLVTSTPTITGINGGTAIQNGSIKTGGYAGFTSAPTACYVDVTGPQSYSIELAGFSASGGTFGFTMQDLSDGQTGVIPFTSGAFSASLRLFNATESSSTPIIYEPIAGYAFSATESVNVNTGIGSFYNGFTGDVGLNDFIYYPTAGSTSIDPDGTIFSDVADGYVLSGLVWRSGDASVVAHSVIINADGAANTPPVLSPIGDRSVIVGNLLTFDVSATDAEGSTTITADSLPTGATFDGTTFAWTPDAGGTEPIVFTATDQQGLTDSETINITMVVDAPPILATIGDKTIAIGQELTFDVSATDVEGPVTITTDLLPAGATFDGTTFAWTPSIEADRAITFTATDNNGSTDTEVITVTVTGPIDTTAPIWETPPYQTAITAVGCNIRGNVSEDATVYAVRRSNTDPAPTSAEVKAGIGLEAHSQQVLQSVRFTITFNTAEKDWTYYRYYTVAEDAAGNITSPPRLRTVRTSDTNPTISAVVDSTTDAGHTITVTTDQVGTVTITRNDGDTLTDAIVDELTLNMQGGNPLTEYTYSIIVTDEQGNDSDITTLVATTSGFVPGPITGGVTITGNDLAPATLTAANDIFDPNGTGEITYTWIDRQNVELGTGQEFIAGEPLVWTNVRCRASYINGAGISVTITSDEFGPIIGNRQPTGKVWITYG